jgi:hypothetical protein
MRAYSGQFRLNPLCFSNIKLAKLVFEQNPGKVYEPE